jgi:hypothetical protein
MDRKGLLTCRVSPGLAPAWPVSLYSFTVEPDGPVLAGQYGRLITMSGPPGSDVLQSCLSVVLLPFGRIRRIIAEGGTPGRGDSQPLLPNRSHSGLEIRQVF